MLGSTLFLVAGERSGDLHAVELLKAYQEIQGEHSWRVAGLGGAELKKKFGSEFEDWVDEAAVIGLTEVLKKYGWFKRKFAETLARIKKLAPEMVILVDYPGFNLRLAKELRKRGYTGKICYYISPQVWAWNKGRIPKMGKLLDLMLCVFEFEKELYEQSGLKTEWVGHPMVEELEERRRGVKRRSDLVGLFPGSRKREVKALLPVMLAASEEIARSNADLEFELAVASPHLMESVESLLAESFLTKESRFRIRVGESHRLMQEASAAWVASGTATLEAGYYGLPYALVYKVSSLTYWVARTVVKIPYIGMVNILANQLVVKEYVQGAATGDQLAEEMQRLLFNEPYRLEMQEALAKVRELLGGGGAHQKAAQALAESLC